MSELAVARGFRIGSVYQDDPDTRYQAVFARGYNVMTAYVDWVTLDRTSRTSCDFLGADRAVEFGEQHGFEIHCHPLVSHDIIPNWVTRLLRSRVEAAMNDHIDRVVGRYAGRVKLWDAVNEAVADDGQGLWQGFAWSNARATTTSPRPFSARTRRTRTPSCDTTITRNYSGPSWVPSRPHPHPCPSPGAGEGELPFSPSG